MTRSEGASLHTPSPASLPTDRSAGDGLQKVLASLDDAKAEDTVTIDIQGKSALGDFMVVTSGRSHRHVGAIADRLVSDLKQAKLRPVRVGGLPHGDWGRVDAGDLAVHLSLPEL